MLYALVYWLLRRLIGLMVGPLSPGTTTSKSSSFAISSRCSGARWAVLASASAIGC